MSSPLSDPVSPPPSSSAVTRRHRLLLRLRQGNPHRIFPWLSPRRWRKRLLLVGAALLAGTISIFFAIGAERAIAWHHNLMQQGAWLTLFIAPAGFAALAWISMRFFPGTEGSGIPQTIAASISDDPGVRRQFLSFRIAIAKVFLTLGGLLSGASIGREGPSVQVGASAMHLLTHKWLGRIASSRDLIVAGSGAGIAAAFNTPLGGIMFAIEEMCRYRAFRANSATLVAVIFAGLMSLALLGSYVYFGRTMASITLWPDGIWPVLAAGILGGLFGGGFSRLLIASSRGLPGMVGEISRQRPIAFAAACGLATGLLGLASGGLTYGTGYDESRTALEGGAELPIYFMFAKMAVIWLAFASRIPGGIFAPSLAVGAGLGTLITALLPVMPADQHAALLVLGMGGFLAAMTQAPITSFVIVMEMTGNYEMLLPLMLTTVIAYGISKSVCHMPLYHALAMPALYRAQLKQRHMAEVAAQERQP